MSDSIADICKALGESVQAELPYISGSFTLGPNETGLFYRGPNGLGLLDLTTATEEDLQALSHACQPASFGVGGEDVLDSTYRKAGKMDATAFSSQFSPMNHGIVELIQQDLFKGGDGRGVGVELYKLNVYGPGSFFKSHIDTPRSENMFGSLVVVLPTVHEGGSLIFRHADKEWTFDSASAVEVSTQSSDSPPLFKVAFAAFYSDVEHEVTPVIAGYRVTLTYNLYFKDTLSSEASTVQSQSNSTIDIRNRLNDLLSNDSFLKLGGDLGFKLVHKYPVHKSTNLSALTKMLKGPDARILVACRLLGLNTSLRVFYSFDSDITDGSDMKYVMKKPIDADHMDQIEDGYWPEMEMFLTHNCGAMEVRDVNLENVGELGDDVNVKKKARDVYWVNPEVVNRTKVVSTYVAYGNEPSLGYFYGEVAIVAEVGKVGDRKTLKE